MLQMPDLLYFNGSWQEYIDDVYDVVREDILGNAANLLI